jgi:hypothetical protein
MFTGVGVFFALEGNLTPAGAASSVALGLLLIGSALAGIMWYRIPLHIGMPGFKSPAAGLGSGANGPGQTLPMALLALRAGLAAGKCPVQAPPLKYLGILLIIFK